MPATNLDIRYVRAADQPLDPLPEDLGEPLDVAPAVGRWRNSNARTAGISHAEVTLRDGRLYLAMWAVDPTSDGYLEWGETPVDACYADSPWTKRIIAYTARYELGHAHVEIQANINHGLTVYAMFTRFTDSTGRVNCFTREFFHRGEPA